MASYANEQNYSEMIAALQTFSSKVSESCEEMSSAGNECVDNMDGDPAAEKSNAKLQNSVGQIRESLSEVGKIISTMQDELEDIRRAAAIADSI